MNYAISDYGGGWALWSRACANPGSPCPSSVWAYDAMIWNSLQSGFHLAICSSEPRLLRDFWNTLCRLKASSPETALSGKDTVVE